MGVEMIYKFLVVTLLLGLTACSTTVTPGRTRVEAGGVTITTDPGHNGTFCPPGQQKKGRC